MAKTRRPRDGTQPARLSEADLARRRLRRFVYGIVIIILVIAVGGRIQWRSEPRPGSEAVAKRGAWRLTAIPTNYRATFRVETHAQDRTITNTERVWMRRPFESRIETWSGKPPGAKRLDYRQSAFGTLVSVSPRSSPLNVAVTPSVASGDLRVDIALRDAVRRRVVQERERRRVYGHECQVYRAGGPIAAGDLTRYRPKSKDYADVCVERHGVVIEEWWVQSGKLLRRRVATSLHISGRIPSTLFEITATSADTPHRGSIERDTSSGTGAKLWTLPKAPDGFTSLGRYIVVRPSAAQTTFGGGEGLPVASTTDVFVRGPDIIVVDQSPSLAAAAAAEERTTFDVKVKGFAEAQLILDARSNEIRIPTPDGSFVRIVGTISPERLTAVARQLQLVES